MLHLCTISVCNLKNGNDSINLLGVVSGDNYSVFSQANL